MTIQNTRKTALALSMLLTITSLGGCTALLVDGSDSNGYSSSTNTQPFNATSQDQSITAAVKSTLIKDHQINAFDININTYRGIVTLYGHTKSTALRTRTIKLSRSVNGVKQVISKLTITQ